jgi:hypothetical protein
MVAGDVGMNSEELCDLAGGYGLNRFPDGDVDAATSGIPKR